MNTDNTQTTTDLYRFYAADGTLLYIGISKSAIIRMVQHATEKSWWKEVAAIKIEQITGTRRDAENVERRAIHTEAPKYNIVHNMGIAISPVQEQIDHERFARETAERQQRLIDAKTKRIAEAQQLKQTIQELNEQADNYREQAESLEIELDALRVKIGLIQQKLEAEQTRAAIERLGQVLNP